MSDGETGSPDGRYAARFRLVRLQLACFVTPAQFVHQVLKKGRRGRGLGAEALSKPLADGVANRSAGRAIDRFDIVGAWAFHDEFRFLTIDSVR